MPSRVGFLPGPPHLLLVWDGSAGFFRDDYDNVGLQLDLAAAGSVPMGKRFGFEPRVGAGILAGGGLTLSAWTLGAGLTARVTPSFGLRVDYTYHRLIGVGFNFQSISEVSVGPFWSQ